MKRVSSIRSANRQQQGLRDPFSKSAKLQMLGIQEDSMLLDSEHKLEVEEVDGHMKERQVNHSKKLRAKLQKLKDDIWEKLIFNGAEWGIILNCSNVIYQFNSFRNPESEAHLTMNYVYSAFTVTSITLYILGYCKNSKYITPAY